MKSHRKELWFEIPQRRALANITPQIYSLAMDDYFALEDRIAALIERGDIDDAAFNDAATEVYRFQRSHNEPFDNFCRHLGVPLEIKDWRAIPAVPQSAFKQLPLRCFPANETVKTFRTSGTTGEGFGEHHFRSLRLCALSILRGWDFFEMPRLPQVVLTPTLTQTPDSSLSHMTDTLRARATDGVQHFCIGDDGKLDVEKMCALLRRHIQSRAPVLLPGTALAFLHFFDALEKRGETFALPPGSFAMETGGYKGSGRSLSKVELYAQFSRFLGLPPDSVINEYGMTELSSQFYTRGIGRAHRAPPWTRALVIDPESRREAASGAIGFLRIVDLANVGSTLAIETQDLAIRREDGFELLGRDPAALPRGCSRAADEMLGRKNA